MDDVDRFAKLPVKNLISRIKEIEKDIELRDNILESSLNKIGTRLLRLKERISRMKYSDVREFENEIERLNRRKVDEFISWFHDVSRLKERLTIAKEELEFEKEKLKYFS